jgi:outer membrane protein W
MRFVRSLLAVGVIGALAVLAPRAAQAQAQADRAFEDSWFWGVKGGVMQFWTSDVNHAPAPLAGLDMLITRRNVGLNIALDQAFFDETGTYPEYDFDGVSLGTEGRARLRNMRRYSASLLAFPKRYGALRPYAGIGFALNVIQKTDVLASDPQADAETSIEDVRSRGAVLLTGGVQGQFRRVSLFGQVALMPAKSRFFFSNNETVFLEAGVRYNIGSSRAGQGR